MPTADALALPSLRPWLRLTSMMKRGSLTDRLHVGDVRDDELSLAVQSILPRGQYFAETRSIEYATSQASRAVPASVGPTYAMQ